MNTTQIEHNLQELIKNINKETFIYDLLLAYGLPKASITRLRKGSLNMAKEDGEISWKKKLYFKEVDNADLQAVVADISKKINHNERFVVATDYITIVAIDTKTQDKVEFSITDLPKHYDFFLPWAGMEKALHKDENPADVKAAEKMARLFDVIKKDNPDDSPLFIHGLNVFLSRLLFCFFAEDTHIFEENQFTNTIDSHTQADGSDLNDFINRFFYVLNTPKNERKNLPDYLNDFPYVNGGLFKVFIPAPKFSRSSRAAIINSGDQDWSAINPDIFGSMFQAVISADQRGNLGQHYTSVPNIMKVIEPLFLNELYEEYEKGKNEPKKLRDLLNRISKIKIFDPACGSGNFLIVAYKELRILEIEIIKQLKRLQAQASGFNPKEEQLEIFDIPKAQLSLAASFQVELFSRIELNHFYGIEIDDFAGEIAKLALWLAEHQMNIEFYNEFGRSNPTLPLSEAGHIVQGNATRLNWDEVCPKYHTDTEPAEVYILGNPPYLGYSLQNRSQKDDMKYVFTGFKSYKNLDYICSWFWKSAQFIKGNNVSAAFVSTNSINQGEQIINIWAPIFKLGIEISFAHQAFKWANNAKSKAGVTCVIVGIQNLSNKQKQIYLNNRKKEVKNISPYLSEGDNHFVIKRTRPLSELPEILRGSGPVDGGNLIISKDEKERITKKYPSSKPFFRKLIGASELINSNERWCLWIVKSNYKGAIEIPEIKEKVESVKKFREKSKKNATVLLSKQPYRFGEIRHKEEDFILVPSHSSESRKYVPIGFLKKGTVTTNSAQAIFSSEPYVFGVVTSMMHMTWIRSVCGSLETRIRYSSQLGYNTFPFPPISTQRKNEITQAVFRILEEREKHPDKTMAELYDPDKMPEGLREAHRQNDIIIEKCYRSTPFNSDEERLAYLFKLYEKMIAEEQEQRTLFAKEKKKRKKKQK